MRMATYHVAVWLQSSRESFTASKTSEETAGNAIEGPSNASKGPANAIEGWREVAGDTSE